MGKLIDSLSSKYMNAACSVAKTVDDVKALASTKAGAVVIGSITPLKREGNEEPRWFSGDGFALNAFGMPNEGKDFYSQALPVMAKIVRASGKKCILSIAGFSQTDYVSLAELAKHVDLLELNLGCPNVHADGVQHPIVSFDQSAMKDLLKSVLKVTGDTPVSVKLSPYTNPVELASVAKLLNGYPIEAVVTMNTLPNAFWASGKNPVLKPNNGYGGMSGAAVLPFALGQVRQFRESLSINISVIGVGGIENSDDAQRMFEAGANAVQAATLIVRDGHAALDRIGV